MSVFVGECEVCLTYERNLRRWLRGPTQEWVENRIALLLSRNNDILRLLDESKEKAELQIHKGYDIFTAAHSFVEGDPIPEEHGNYHKHEILLEEGETVDELRLLSRRWTDGSWEGGFDPNFTLEQLLEIRDNCLLDFIII